MSEYTPKEYVPSLVDIKLWAVAYLRSRFGFSQELAEKRVDDGLAAHDARIRAEVIDWMTDYIEGWGIAATGKIHPQHAAREHFNLTEDGASDE